MNAVIFSGTTEGRELSRKLAALGIDVLVSVATPLGQEEQGIAAGVAVRCGRLEQEQMAELLRGKAVCIDATHPYAVEATRNIRTACTRAQVPYLRLLRAQSPLPEDCLAFTNIEQLVQALQNTEGNILLTTGAKKLGSFVALPPQRLYPRVLPTIEGIAACEAAGIPHRNIIAMQGPFSLAMNEAMLDQYQISYLVTKDGGTAGGFAEKAAAAKATGAKLVVLCRPPEKGQTETQIIRECKEMLLQCR